MTLKTRMLATSLLGTACLFAGTAALAQDAAADTIGADGNDIVVTARQRSESLQQVPDSITAFSAKTIQEAGIRSIDDVTALMPNISLVDSQDAGTVAINIRGIGQVRNGEAPVALVIDGVQMTSTDMIKQALVDLDQIEVLKGPQGALYGRNAIGGAINITTKRPTNELQGLARLCQWRRSPPVGQPERRAGARSGAVPRGRRLSQVRRRLPQCHAQPEGRLRRGSEPARPAADHADRPADDRPARRLWRPEGGRVLVHPAARRPAEQHDHPDPGRRAGQEPAHREGRVAQGRL
jgi:iron complex outermembrane receptor protein